MPKKDMNALLKQRMTGTQRASELQVGDEAYETLFQKSVPNSRAVIRDIPMENLRPFFTADIGFRPYPPDKLKAFAEQLAEEGVFERIIVRPVPDSEDFEIIAGHNRTAGGKLNGWAAMPAEVIEADDERATSIAIATNLMRRQGLTIIERGKAYKALLDAKNRNGQRNAAAETFGDNRQRYNARKIVADFFGVTEYEIRKAVKLTTLIPDLQTVLEEQSKKLSIVCAELIADYDAESQEAFVQMCAIEGYQINKATVNYIVQKCPPPCADRQLIYAAWREARASEERRSAMPPKKISFERKKFAPYIEKAGGEDALEKLFLEFLSKHFG